jgi:hypothetical protein
VSVLVADAVTLQLEDLPKEEGGSAVEDLMMEGRGAGGAFPGDDLSGGWVGEVGGGTHD